MKISKELLAVIDAHNLGEYALAGSAPLGAHGLRAIDDLDVLVSKAVYEALKERFPPHPSQQETIVLAPKVDVSWTFPTMSQSDLDEVRANAQVLDGYRFASLDSVLTWKRRMNRPKDRTDIVLITEYLRARGANL